MRVLFFGLPLGALSLLARGHTLTHAVICRKDALGLRRIRGKLGGDRVLVKPKLDTHVLTALAAEKPELVVSWFWTERLPPAVLSMAPLGALGVHPSLLPRHRGPDPTYWTILCGDPVTGVTAHVLDAEYDTGAILGKRTLVVDPSWNAWTLAKKLDRPSLALLCDTVDQRPQLPLQVQEQTLATLAPAPTEDDLELDVQLPAEHVQRHIRAAAPYPGAYFYVGDHAVAVLKAECMDVYPRALTVGECGVERDAQDGSKSVILRCGSGALRLLSIRDEESGKEWSGAEVADAHFWDFG